MVPGLANLYGPLGFNNSRLLLAAMLDLGPACRLAHHLVNGVFALGLGIQALVALQRLIWRQDVRPHTAFDALMFVPVIFYAASPLEVHLPGAALTSFRTDLPATMLLLAGSSLAVRIATEPTTEWLQQRARFVAMSLVFAAAITIKLSGAIFVAVTFAIAALLLAHGPDAQLHRRRTIPLGAAIALAVALLWTARGFVLSGWLGFPATILSLPVDWRVPIEHARAEWALIAYTERAFAFETGARWFARVVEARHCLIVPLAIALLLTPRLARSEGTANRALLYVPAALLAMVFWYSSAPSLDYGMALFWSLAGLVVAAATTGCGTRRAIPRRLAAVIVVLALDVFLRPATATLWRGEAGRCNRATRGVRQRGARRGAVRSNPKATGTRDLHNAFRTSRLCGAVSVLGLGTAVHTQPGEESSASPPSASRERFRR